MTRIQFLLLSLLLLVCSSVSAQSNYPIYVTPTLTPPYSLKLSDYGAVGSQHLMVQINVNDLNIVDLPVKLHIKLETAGVTIETPPTINTTPIFLNGGVTSILFGEDLADYFHINNLMFKGYSKDAYKRSGQLPGGFYKFTVEVLHYNTNRLISNSGTTSAWIVLGKPPVLQLPEQGEEMGQYPGMPLSFSWLASNVGSPVSVGTIQYTFELWEMRVEGVDPNTVVQSIPVFHEETTFNTFCQIYPATLMMEPGMRYAWRITAKDASGYVPFEQDGHSQVRTFIYKAKCEDVNQLKAGARGRSATFTWDVEPNHTSFNVELRQPATGWMLNSETYDSKAAFFDLDQGQVYEMRVQAVCNADPSSVSDYSEWTSVKIPVQQPLIDTLNCPTCGCDDNLPQVNLTNFELRNDLAPGDTLINKTGTTRFILHKVEPQTADTYTGIFYYWAEIWGIKFVCEYDNLQVNTDNVIVNMNFESVYDPQFLLDADALSDYLGDLADNIATVTTGMEVKDTLKVDEPFDAIYVNDQGEVVAVTVDADGQVDEKVIGHTSDLDKTLVTDEDGKEYVISGNGQAMGVEEFKATGGNSRLVKKHNQEKETNNLAQGGMVGFSALAKQHYGFDTFDEHKQAIQQHYTPLNNGYRPAWKSLQAFGADQVEADNYNNIVFKDEMGLPAVATSAGLSLRGSFDGAEVPLYAYRDTNTIVGKLNMVSYAPKTLKLIIVPVNKAQIPDAMNLQTTLNTIYKQAVVSWQVEPVNTPVELDFPGGQMTHGGSGGFTTYNADQKAIINAFIGQGNVIDKNAFYLFFVEGVKNKERSISGYMPLQRQMGFIYDNPNNTIIAHELAHGAFNLYHTFSEHGFIAPEGATQNLMDYATGASQLWKHQWDKIHNPENIVFAFMQEEKEGESISTEQIADELESEGINITNGLSFITPAGKIISLPIGSKAFNFVTNKNYVPNGALLGFIDPNGRKYNALYNRKSKEFLGYAVKINPNAEIIEDRYKSNNDKEIPFYKDVLTKEKGHEVEVLLGYRRYCEIELHAITIVNPQNEEHSGSGTIGDTDEIRYSGSVLIGRYSDKQACNEAISEPLVEESFTPSGIDLNKVTFDQIEGKFNSAAVRFADKVVKAISERERSYSKDNLYKEGFYHIVGKENLAFYNEGNGRYDILEHKLQYLKERTGKTVIAIYEPVDFVMQGKYNNLFAKAVFDLVVKELPNNKDNLILITIPYVYINKHISRTSKFDAQQYVMPGIFCSPNTVVTDKLKKDYKSTFDFISDTYKYTKKPLVVYMMAVNVDGSITKRVNTRKEDIAGYNSIVTVRYLVNKGFYKLRNLKPKYYLCGDPERGTDVQEFLLCYDIADYNYQKEKNIIIQRHLNDSLADYSELTDISNPLKEKYVDEYVEIHFKKAIDDQLAFVEWLETAKILWVDGDSDISVNNFDQVCYNYSWLTIIDPIIYAGIDIASIVAGPYDFVLEGIGLSYALYRGDSDSYTSYAIGLSIPVGGVVVVKIIQKSAKVLKTGTRLFYKGAIYIVEEGGTQARKIADNLIEQHTALGRIFGFNDISKADLALVNQLDAYLETGYDVTVVNKSKAFSSESERVAYLKSITGQARKEITNSLFAKFKKFTTNDELATKLSQLIRDEHHHLSDYIDDYLAELLVRAGNNNTKILAQLSSWDPKVLIGLSKDLENTNFATAFFDLVGKKPELVESWKSFKNAGLDDLARNTDQLAKFDALAKSNNLGLDAKGLEDLLSARTATKNLPWEHPDEVLDAVKRASDANIDGVSIKGFPEPADGNTSFILDNAKQYQKEASGDAFLSFDKNGVSFDNVDADGILIDRKYGHSSVFNADGTVANQTRAKSILEQAKRQLSAVGGDGTKLRWEISSKGGADGIERLFLENADDIPGLDMIKVDHVAQKTIITN